MHAITLETQTLQNKLIGALIGLARATENNTHLITNATNKVMLKGLAALGTNTNTPPALLEVLMQEVLEQKKQLVPNCFSCAAPCGRTSDYDVTNWENAAKKVYALKSQILHEISDLAVHVYRAFLLGSEDPAITFFFYKALYSLGMDNWSEDELLPIIAELQEIQLLYSHS